MAASLVVGAAVVAAAGVALRTLPLPGLLAVAVALLLVPAALAVRRRAHGTAAAAAMAALALAPWVTVPSWVVAHPVLHVDNAIATTIDVWIDGRRRLTVGPAGGEREPPFVRIPLGWHRIGWSAAGASAPVHEAYFEITPFAEHLYTPGGAGCYWIAVTAYGGASTHGWAHGPQPLAEYHRLDRVDVWFGPTPESVHQPPLASGAVRVAVQRWAACMDLFGRCDPDARREFVDCMRTIDGRAGSSDCWSAASKRCPTAASLRSGAASVAGAASARP